MLWVTVIAALIVLLYLSHNLGCRLKLRCVTLTVCEVLDFDDDKAHTIANELSPNARYWLNTLDTGAGYHKYIEALLLEAETIRGDTEKEARRLYSDTLVVERAINQALGI